MTTSSPATETEPMYRVVQVRLPDSGRIYRYKAPLSRRLCPGLDAVRVMTPRGMEIGDVVGVLGPDDEMPTVELKWIEPQPDGI